jgi:hypothetical protein
VQDEQPAQAFARLLWAIPLSVLIHNLEEYPRIVDYAQRHGLAINRRQMGIAVILATLLPVPIVAAANNRPASRRHLQIALAIPALMAVNGGTHLAQTLFLRDYSPGTVTGIMLNVPLAILLYQQAIRAGRLRGREARQAAVAGAGLMAPAALMLQLIGWGIDRALQRLTSDTRSR